MDQLQAQLKSIFKNLAHELGREGFFCLSVHPGWVQTRMGGGGAPLGLSTAVEQVLENALSEDRTDSGGFKGPGRAVSDAQAAAGTLFRVPLQFTPQTIRDVFGVEVEIGHSPQTGAPRIYPIRPSTR